MDEMKRQLFEQERWIYRLSALSGLVYMLSNSLQAVEMDGKDDYINAVGYISSSLSETELALQQLSEEMFTSFRGWKAQTYALLQEYLWKRKKSHKGLFVTKKESILSKKESML